MCQKTLTSYSLEAMLEEPGVIYPLHEPKEGYCLVYHPLGVTDWPMFCTRPLLHDSSHKCQITYPYPVPYISDIVWGS